MQSFYDHQNATYSVAWIDCLAVGKSFGQSILMLGEHAKKDDLKSKFITYPRRKNHKISFCFDAPGFLLNNFTVSIFNKVYLYFNKYKKSSYVEWDSYFYPLDSVGDWNRMYGKKGFFQFQCILPKEKSAKGYKKILKIIQKKSSGSFLAVLKNFGSGNDYMSFPREGLTLALDFKASKTNIAVGRELADIVNDLGGSFYLAKDSILDADQFKQGFDKEEFLKFRNSKINSVQSNRLKL